MGIMVVQKYDERQSFEGSHLRSASKASLSQSEQNLDKTLEELAAKAAGLGVLLEPRQVDLMARFLALLADYNLHTNLVANAEPGTVVRDHLLDSLTLVPWLGKISGPVTAGANRPVHLVDVGSGAGFPGLILALACLDLGVALVEPVAKKARFLESAVALLGVGKRVRVINERAEVIARRSDFREVFLAGTARAVGAADTACELTLPFLAIGGLLLLQKSQAQLGNELGRARTASLLLGGGEPAVVRADVKVLGKEHVILLIEKTNQTKDCYPRTAALMKRRPLAGPR